MVNVSTYPCKINWLNALFIDLHGVFYSYAAAAAADGWRGKTWFSLVGDSGIVANPGSWLTKLVMSQSQQERVVSTVEESVFLPQFLVEEEDVWW